MLEQINIKEQTNLPCGLQKYSTLSRRNTTARSVSVDHEERFSFKGNSTEGGVERETIQCKPDKRYLSHMTNVHQNNGKLYRSYAILIQCDKNGTLTCVLNTSSKSIHS